MPTPDCVAVTEMRYVPFSGGKINANHLRVDPVFQSQAILGASRGYGGPGDGHGRMGGNANLRIRARWGCGHREPEPAAQRLEPAERGLLGAGRGESRVRGQFEYPHLHRLRKTP